MAKHSPILWNTINKIVSNGDEGNTLEKEENTEKLQVPWCICGKCMEMPTERERICCQNSALNHELPFFEHHVLFEPTLVLAMRNKWDHLNYPFDPTNPTCWRFTAQKQFCLRAWGKLGKNNCKVIPSCCVWSIRDKFPDANGNYTGFFMWSSIFKFSNWVDLLFSLAFNFFISHFVILMFSLLIILQCIT